MLTYLDLKNHALLAIGGRPSTASGQTVAQRYAEIVNTAGEHLFSHQWKFRETYSNLTTVAAQSYLSLPADFGELITAWLDNASIRICTPADVEAARLNQVSDSVTWSYVRTIVPTNSTAQSSRLELYPTPVSALTLKVLYRTAWQGVSSSTSDTEVIQIPKHVEATMIAYVRAVAEAYEDGQQSQRFAEIEAGPIFGAAKQKDGMVQSHFGQIAPIRWNQTRDFGFTINSPVQNPS